MELIDIQWAFASVMRRATEFIEKTGRTDLATSPNTTYDFNKAKVTCFNYGGKGHFKRECTQPAQQVNRNPFNSNYQNCQSQNQVTYQNQNNNNYQSQNNYQNRQKTSSNNSARQTTIPIQTQTKVPHNPTRTIIPIPHQIANNKTKTKIRL